MYPIAACLFGIAFVISTTLAVYLLVRVSELKSKLINTSAESQARLWTMGVLENERDQFSRISIDQRRAVMEKDEEITRLKGELSESQTLLQTYLDDFKRRLRKEDREQQPSQDVATPTSNPNDLESLGKKLNRSSLSMVRLSVQPEGGMG